MTQAIDQSTLPRKRTQQLRMELQIATQREERGRITKELWANQRTIRRHKAMTDLSALTNNLKPEMSTPSCMWIDGKPSYDREAWLQTAYSFGASRFHDPGNPLKEQVMRLERAYSTIQAERVDGKKLWSPEPWDTIQSRA